MTYREYKKWCNDRACDGCWSFINAQYCIMIIETIQKYPFWKREKIWKNAECAILADIIYPTNDKIKESLGKE